MGIVCVPNLEFLASRVRKLVFHFFTEYHHIPTDDVSELSDCQSKVDQLNKMVSGAVTFNISHLRVTL